MVLWRVIHLWNFSSSNDEKCYLDLYVIFFSGTRCSTDSARVWNLFVLWTLSCNTTPIKSFLLPIWPLLFCLLLLSKSPWSNTASNSRLFLWMVWCPTPICPEKQQQQQQQHQQWTRPQQFQGVQGIWKLKSEIGIISARIWVKEHLGTTTQEPVILGILGFQLVRLGKGRKTRNALFKSKHLDRILFPYVKGKYAIHTSYLFAQKGSHFWWRAVQYIYIYIGFQDFSHPQCFRGLKTISLKLSIL